MNLRTKLLGAIYVLIATTVSGEKWSRQLANNNDNYSRQILDDWIPIGSSSQQKLQNAESPAAEVNEKPEQLQQENDRSEHARALTYPQNIFAGSNNQQSIQKRNPQFNFVHPFQFAQFQQTQKDQPNQLQQQQPTSQSFFKFEMPSFGIDGSRNIAPAIQTGYQIQHSFGPASHQQQQQQSVLTSPLFSQKPVFPPEFHPVQNSHPQQPHVNRKPIQQNLIEETKPQHIKDSKATQAQNNFVSQRPSDLFQSGQHQQHIQQQHSQQNQQQQQQFQLQKPTSFQAQYPAFRQQQNLQGQTLQSAPLSQEEEVQLLYVPYDTLYPQRNEHQQQQQQIGFNAGKYNLVQEPVNPIQINNFYTQDPIENPQPKVYTTTTTSTTSRPTSSTYKPSANFQEYFNPRYSTIKPTSKPKPKPHQPPLAMFYQKQSLRTSPKDVVDALSSTKSIAVLDAPAKSSPEVFIGPAGLPTPSGYSKFELPYLSSFDHNNLESNLKETPFFVAPLSYKTPSGFEKIVLPEPHVGSIVIHKPINIDENNILRGTNRFTQRPTKQMYITPLDNGNVNHFRNTTPKQQTTTRLQPSPSAPSHRWQVDQNRVTQPPKDYFRNQYQEAIQEISSPQTYQKPNHQRRPESVFTQTVKPYAQFKPMPSNIANDEYFKSKPTVSSTFAPSSSPSPSPTSSPSTSPKPYFTETYPTSPEIQTTRGHLYEVSSLRPSSRPEENRDQFFDVSSARPSARPEIETTRETYYEITKPETLPSPTPGDGNDIRGQYYGTSSSSPSTYEPEKEDYLLSNRRPSVRPEVVKHKYQSKPLFDDEYKIKTYFRQQDIFKNRPTAPSSTQQGHHENIQYTPVSIDYDNPSSTANYFEGSTLRTTTPKYTFFHPTAQSYDENVQSNTLPSNEESKDTESNNQSPAPELTVRPISERIRPTHATRVPVNHRPTYDNEVTFYNHDEKSLDNAFNENPYNSPSELPPLTPNLPGLVNALKENERLNAIEKETIENESTTTSTTLRPTRRPITNRGRRPTTRTSTSSSVSYSSSDDVTTRRPINRVRRPFNPRNNTYTTKSIVEDGSTTSKTTPLRNPNRIRYNPTTEERKQFRTRTRTQTSTTATKKNKVKTQEDNIDYQRDVLKQNYPVFRHPTRKPFFTTTQKSDEIVTVTPNSLKDGFPGLLEPMQIAQQYQHQGQDNYGPGYFPNEEEINPTEQINNEIYQTTTPAALTTSSSTEPSITTTKRSSLFRRQRPRTTTTTEASVNTEPSNTERYTIRPSRQRADGNGNLPRKVIKIRARTRRPHPASTTVEPERTGKENSYQKVSRFNQDFYRDDYKNEDKKRAQLKTKFNLEPQESQWSPSLTRSDSFKPLNPGEGLKDVKFDNEPEIVTAEPKSETRNTKDTYEFNVSAGFGPKINSYGSVLKSDSRKIAAQSKLDRKVEPTFEELLEQVMSDISREAKKVENIETTTTEEPTRKLKFTEKDTRSSAHHRRGVWKKVRVQPTDGFETAESQNIGTQLLNQIFNDEKINSESKFSETKTEINEVEATTMTPIEKTESEITTIMPETVIPETEQPNFETKVETITSISQEISRSHSGVHNLHVTSTPEPIKEVDSTTTRFYNQDYEEDETIGDTITRRIDEGRSDDGGISETGVIDDLETQPSLFDEVRSQLKDLFAAEADDEEEIDGIKPNFHPRKQEYTSIQRIRPVTEQPNDETTPVVTTSPDTSFHKNLMKNLVYATSTSTEISQETEICYRGRCVKSRKPL